MTFLESFFQPRPVFAIPDPPVGAVVYRSQQPERVWIKNLGFADVIGARWRNGDVGEVHIRLAYGEMYVPPAVVCEGDNVVSLMEGRVSRTRVVPIGVGPVVA